MIEITSGISENIQQCQANLHHTLQRLQDITQKMGLALISCGTHPFQKWDERQIYPKSRYLRLLNKYQWLAKRMNIYGIHVHVGIENGDKLIRILNHLIQYLPHLLALSGSSPFWEGRDTGMNSCRAHIITEAPHGGFPNFFHNWSEFEEYYTTMIRAGAIESFKDLHWFIRPNLKYQTIEIRICDAVPTLSDAISLIALIHTLVVWIDKKTGPDTTCQKRYWFASENLWSAARYEIKGPLIENECEKTTTIKQSLTTLIDKLLPTATELGCVKEIKKVLKSEKHSDRQRKKFEETGDLKTVVTNLIQ